MAVPDVASSRAPRWWPVPEAATPRGGRYGMTLLVIAAVYFGAAKLGLTMAFVAEQVTAVWPPTGIALVAILLFGYRVWPGIWLGAFLANATAHEPLLTAVGIAIGNTLEAVTGAWLLHRVAGFGKSLDRLQDALGLVVLAALGSTTVSATLGSAALVLGGLQPWTAFGRLWWVWWLGDAMGDLVMAPVLLTWATAGRRPPLFRLAEAGALIASLVAVSLVVFAGPFTRITSSYPLEYVVFPFVMWAALRFGQLGTTTVTFVASAIAIWGTVNGFGPFAKGTTVHESLILLQIFMGVVAVSGLLLAAVMNERQIAARRRVVGYAVTQALAESGTLEEAAPRILRAIGESLEWNLGALWRVDEDANVLRCLDVWHGASGDFAEFAAVTRGASFRRGSGLPGRVWASGAAAWIPDVVRDRNCPRAPVAARARLHGAFGFAIVRGDRVLGVLEFFSREIQRPDDDLLELAAAIGSQIGQFIERRRSLAEQQRTERALRERESAARRDAEQAHERAAFLAEASKRLASSLDYRATLESVAHLTIPLLADASCVDLIEENGRLSRVAVAGSEAAVSTEPPDVAPPPAVDGVLRSGKPAVSPPLGESPAEGGDGVPTSSMIVPLVVGGRTLGAVTFLLTRPGRRYGPADLALAEELARRAAAAIDHARLFRAAEAAQAEAEAANRAKDQYLSTLSHELRTPLNAIVGWAEVLRRHPDQATVARGMDTIARNAKAQARLIDDLLDISRVISGKLQLDMRPVDLVSVITAAVDAARPAADEKGLQLDAVLDAATGSVFGDAHRLQQVVA
ncbi:MAG TPA: MASE1 domain-containing protein, partial [Methylomirabilota bacterium]|nr:MASE1 domain-containing protein [Methylomirabilota bacterium]